MGTTHSADGTTLAFDDHAGGDGTPVILVHGITESAVTWGPLIDRLTPNRRVVAVDLRGHGRSGKAERYDLEAMAGDIAAVAVHLGIDRPHLVGHSLGGAVVSAAGAAMPVSSVVDVDQSLQLDAFKGQLMGFADQLRDPAAFPLVIEALFQMMAGDKISPDEMARVDEARRPDQDVVLGVWELLLTESTEHIATVVDEALAGYDGVDVDYLALFGIDPGEGYGDWLAGHIDGAVTEVWADHGHYPHLVDPDRFVARLDAFWS
ncbi:alpha/beta fold hydrolase [Ilumatobacter nonamiensis]|uniref:alpha/beta fold hydrolase n=1 Tax=Ilumatobacter nonamiensis TaxID=467093 RepID=UPI00034CA7FE|nr:alpha/beta hydrolase [Ilumatobacter nonamiensis]